MPLLHLLPGYRSNNVLDDDDDDEIEKRAMNIDCISVLSGFSAENLGG